jgi:argininosuccinate lyase
VSAAPGRGFQRPIWDRGEAIDPEMLAFTVGDDWLQDRRLVEVDLRGSLAHARGLARVGLITQVDLAAIERGLTQLLEAFGRGEWTVEASDEDVHSAVERRLIDLVGDAGKKLHTARSRNEQVAVDLRLWLRGATSQAESRVAELVRACRTLQAAHGKLPLPGYTHLRAAMPSSVGDWSAAHFQALEQDLGEFEAVRRRIALCPLGSGAGYGLPVDLDRTGVARELGFEGPEEPVTLVQHGRGRAELAYVSALEQIALDAGKLAFDLWLFTAHEFGFARLPVALTTGSSMMPHKRNPDLLELARAHCRQVSADRQAILDVLRDLPSGYHRDFQLLKPPLFRAHDRALACLQQLSKVIGAVEWHEDRLREACSDPDLQATARALERARQGVPFRDAYREESRRTQS